MKRFILLSFVFLGVGFYELSGGSDFDPETTRIAAVEARLMRDAARKEALPAAAEVFAAEVAPSVETQSTDDVVTRTKLNLVTFASVSAPQAPPAAEPANNWAPEEDIADTPEPMTIAALAEAVAEDRSIVFPGTTISASSDNFEAQADIRFVKGSLVNLRSGPGTNFGVVSQLSQDTQVEILNDSGTGWVELRPVDGGPTGWMADFLLTNG